MKAKPLPLRSKGTRVSRSAARVAGAIAIIVGFSLVLTSCNVLSGPDIGQKIGAKYAHSQAKTIRLDFTKYVGGGWTELTIVCGPVRGSTINRALGFVWAKPKSVQPENGSAILFSTKTQMLESFTVGIDDLNEDQYFVPCFPPGIPNPMVDGTVQVRQVIVVPRNRSTLTLSADHAGLGWPVWYLSTDERKALINSSDSP